MAKADEGPSTRRRNEGRQVIRTDIADTRSDMPPTCMCGSPHFEGRTLESGSFYMLCAECGLGSVIPVELSTIGERAWFRDRAGG